MSNKKKKQQFAKKVNRDEQNAWRKALEIGRAIYEDWKSRFINTPQTPDTILSALNELAALVQQRVEHAGAKEAMLTMADMKIADFAVARGLGMFHMRVHAICPNTIVVNNIPMICNWAGDTFVGREAWDKQLAEITCPSCDNGIPQKHMKPVVFKEETDEKEEAGKN